MPASDDYLYPVDVSFVITAYNAADSVGAAIDSALSQEGGVRLEVVVVDDGSADTTAEIARSYSDRRVRVFEPGRLGRSKALNLALREARGRYIALLDADDRAHPRRAIMQVAYLDAHPGIVALGGQVSVVNAGSGIGHQRRLASPTDPSAVDARLLRGRMPLMNCTVTYRADWAAEVGGYDATLDRVEDFDLFLRGWKPGIYAALSDAVTEYLVPGGFPSWRYWRREEAWRRLVVARWVQSLPKIPGRVRTDAFRPKWVLMATDFWKWVAQGAYTRLERFKPGSVSGRYVSRPLLRRLR